MITPRKLNTAYDARNGAPKVITNAAPVVGQRSQTGPSHNAYTGPGQAALDDEKELPVKSHERVAPVAFGMSQAKQDASPSGNDVLTKAANLGQKA
jgi:hypothetical protein